MAKRRSVAQRAATARLLASNVARRAGGAIATRTRTVIQRVRSAPRTIVRTVRAPRRARRAGLALARGGGAVAIAQARILPGLVGGYIVGKIERNQRKAHADAVTAKAKGETAKGALIADPTNRLLAEAAALALIASRTGGMVREIAVGAAGAVGCLYEMYTSKDGSNPVDGYTDLVKSGNAGV